MMKQAQRRHVVGISLLLWVPLMMASTPPGLAEVSRVVLGPVPGNHLAFASLPSLLPLNGCVPLTMQLLDGSGVPLRATGPLAMNLSTAPLGAGTFSTLPGCLVPATSATIAFNSTQVVVWYRPAQTGGTVIGATSAALGAQGDASASVSVVPNPATSFTVTVETSPVRAGSPATVRVAAQGSLGPAVDYAGTIEFLSSDPIAQLPANYQFNPALDGGEKRFQVVFKTAGSQYIKARDKVTTTIFGADTSPQVQPGPPAQVVIENLAPQAAAGASLGLQVKVFDAFGNPAPGLVAFSSTDPQADLPALTSVSVPPTPPPQLKAVFRTAGTVPQQLTATETSSQVEGTRSITILPGPPAQVALSTAALDPTPACAPVALAMTVKDAFNNPLPDASVSGVKLCKVFNGSAVSLVSPGMTVTSTANDCLTGDFKGSAVAVFRSTTDVDTLFTAQYLAEVSSLPIHWKGRAPGRLTSQPSFSESSELIPTLSTFPGQLTLQFTLRDMCGAELPVAPSRISFGSDPALRLTRVLSPANQVQAAVSVRLPRCPADPSTLLAIWPLIDNEPLFPQSASFLKREVKPLCVPSPVTLAVLTPLAERAVEPGAMVEFHLEVSNSQGPTLKDTVLEFKPVGLKVLEVAAEDSTLTAEGTGFLLPELEKASALKVRVMAQALAQVGQPLSTGVECTLQDGLPITDPLTVEFTQDRLGADVGCHAAGAPGALLPWLAVFLAGSRPWSRLRRLRRGERNEH